MRVILASGSPRRAAIMDLANIDYEIIPSNFDETSVKESDFEKRSQDIAHGKAKEVFDNTQGDRAVIGADTLVIKDDRVFGKPKDKDDAVRMLRTLQGEAHVVYTSLSIMIEDRGKKKEYDEVIKTDILVSPMSDEEINDYIETEMPLDKAGAYAIQSSFCKYIEEMAGNYMGVVGLPIDRVYKILKENDVL